MLVYIGADWSQQSALCTFGNHKQHHSMEITPHPGQVQKLIQQIRSLFPDAQKFRLVIEAGSPLWLRLFHHAQFELFVVDGKQAKRYLESLSPGGAKDDVRDSWGLFLMAQSPKHCQNPYSPGSIELRILEKLVAHHERLISQRTSQLQRLRQQLVELMPGLSSFLKDLSAPSTLALLKRFPVPKKFLSARRKSFDAFCKKHRLRKKTREELWKLKQSCFDLLEPEESEFYAQLIVEMVNRVELLQSSIARIEGEIQSRYQEAEGFEQLASIKGVGPILGATLLAQVLGKSTGKRDSAAIRAGAAPLTIQSGKKKGKRKSEQKKSVRMRKTIPSNLRRMTYLLGLQAICWHDWARAQFEAMRQRGKSAGGAFRGVARSLLRIIEALMKTGEEYDRDKYVAALKKRGVEWAMTLPETLAAQNA